MKLEPAFSTSIPRTLLSIMIFCAVALGAVVFLQNSEISSNSTLMKAQGIEVQQKNNIFLINLECVNGKTTANGKTTQGAEPTQIPQDKVADCVIANQSIGDYLLGANSLPAQGEDTQGNKYTFKDVMSVVNACATSEEPTLTNSVKFEHGKSLLFRCADTAAKKPMEIVAYK